MSDSTDLAGLVSLIAAFGYREAIITLVLLLVLYMLVVVLRMKRLSAPRKADVLSSARYEADLSGRKIDLDRFYDAPERSEPVVPPARATASVTVDEGWRDPPSRERCEAEPVRDHRTGGASVSSLDQEKLNRLERDLAATRFELDALRASFAEVRDELRQEVERLKATQRVSPLYADSMQMAVSGASAEDIVSRCGIARAEADLVLALAQGRSDNPGRAHASQSAASRGMADSHSASEGGQSRYGSF